MDIQQYSKRGRFAVRDDSISDEIDGPQPSKRLQRIADALGCSPDDFLDGSGGPRAMNETAQLLRYWFTLESPVDRDKVLNFVRHLAAA